MNKNVIGIEAGSILNLAVIDILVYCPKVFDSKNLAVFIKLYYTVSGTFSRK